MDKKYQKVFNVLKELGDPKKLASFMESWEIGNLFQFYF